MPTKREYLISKGLAQPGRGRFSREAVAALERARQDGVTFDDEGVGSGNPEPAPRPRPKVNDPVLRDIQHVTGYTEEGYKVQSGVCFKCSRHVSRCACRAGITASPIVVRWDEDSEEYGRTIDNAVQLV